MKARTAGGYKLIFGYLGIFIALIGVITLIPLPWSHRHNGNKGLFFVFLR
jgi:hypothetical protein